MDEFGKAQVGDARLTKRLIKLADRLGSAQQPSQRIITHSAQIWTETTQQAEASRKNY